MNANHNKQVLDFLTKHKEINKTNVLLLDKEITEKQIYELRTYTEGKLSHISFGHSIKGWADQNGVIIANSRPTPKSKESKMSTWTKPQQKYLDNMKNEINQKIDNNHNEIKTDINLLTTAIKELTVKLTKHIEEHK